MTDRNDAANAVWTRAVLVGAGAVILCACAAASIGLPGPIAGSASVLYLVLTQGTLAGLYLLGAFGLGLALVSRVVPSKRPNGALAFGLGLAAMLSISHLLGVFGVLSHRIGAVAPIAVGIAAGARHIPAVLTSLRLASAPSLLWLAAAPAAGVLIAAACSPPGWLWSSEFGGYDSLVYHLQLPREWHDTGRVWPNEHNVYSYLPSFIEVAFAHLGSLAGVPRGMFLTPDGELLIACQLLHAGITLAAGWAAANAVGVVVGEGPGSRPARAAAGALVVATPWSVVTGSMSYNEMAVILLLFSAIHAALLREQTPIRRGLLAGMLVGAACGCKPTALLLGAPVVGLIMLVAIPRAGWVAAFTGGAIAGVLLLLPWLIRNGLAGGNPVFPMLTGLFGSAHWSPEQVERYASAHRFDGSFFDAMRLLVFGDPNDPAAQPGRPVHRGLLHPQWAFAAPLLLVSALTAFIRNRHRVLARALVLGAIVQIVIWALATHVQSRFLMPMLVPIALLFALSFHAVVATVADRSGPTRGVLMTASAALLATSAITAGLFAGERRAAGGPNTLIAIGTPYFTNLQIWEGHPNGPLPDAYLNAVISADATLLTVGDSSPLYKPAGSLYATAYDESPLARAIRQHPDDPRAAMMSLDADYVYVNWIELHRLHTTGWLDPVLAPDQLQSMLMSHAVLEHIFELPSGQVAAQELYRLPEATR